MPQKILSPARMEAFSDGVMAVIITIMVLDLKVPPKDGVAGVWMVLPTLAVYLLSFLQTGIYWVNHHYMMDEVRVVNHAVLWSNLLLLFCLSLIPFATVWTAAKGLSGDSVALYAATCLLPALSYSLLWRAVRASNPGAEAAAGPEKLAISAALYLSAIPAALWRPLAVLLLIGAVAVLWILPPRNLRRKAE